MTKKTILDEIHSGYFAESQILDISNSPIVTKTESQRLFNSFKSLRRINILLIQEATKDENLYLKAGDPDRRIFTKRPTPSKMVESITTMISAMSLLSNRIHSDLSTKKQSNDALLGILRIRKVVISLISDFNRRAWFVFDIEKYTADFQDSYDKTLLEFEEYSPLKKVI